MFSRIIYTDDDEYWKNGTTYNYPNDRSILVTKRMGIATTINIATKTGKSIYYGLFVFVAVLLIGMGGNCTSLRGVERMVRFFIDFKINRMKYNPLVIE
ncbi:DUF5808 domain-containing protein [Paenibacillus odorifer]|uniref:DUF5808 domain-containing protein n=1 Tax=Paenibacillus TaxID=44249 RepID=UPI00351B0B65